ncbi:MAG: biopolymer transport protein ExbB [Kiritimatiellia bacterium]|jgi:biopolymer transport protein ExbB
MLTHTFKRLFALMIVLLGLSLQQPALAQEVAAPAGEVVVAEEAAQVKTGFIQVVMGGGFLGIVLWLMLLLTSIAGMALIVDSFLTIKPSRIMPDELVANVKAAMEQGDVMKSLKHCEAEPGPLANILSAGFSNVEEGYEVIQEAVGIAADLESERLLQRVNYLNVVGNLAPMLGLMGTVQGMIVAFKTLADAGAAAASLLALAISQALYTTLFGLFIAVPALAFFYFFRNRATNIILHMEGLTMDEIKILRNVEVVED